jgi:hypothetical protein
LAGHWQTIGERFERTEKERDDGIKTAFILRMTARKMIATKRSSLPFERCTYSGSRRIGQLEKANVKFNAFVRKEIKH